LPPQVRVREEGPYGWGGWFTLEKGEVVEELGAARGDGFE